MKIQVVGVNWGAYLVQGSLLAITEPTAAMEYTAPNMATREEVREWLDTHAGDFEQVLDFASLPNIEFASEESECFYHDCMVPETL